MMLLKLCYNFPKTDNPRIYNEILEIALHLPGSQSAKLLKQK